MVAASVLPSPVFISAILPSCRAMPPMIWTSKGRIPRVRLEASRTTANASGRRSSRVSPPPNLSRNSSVFAPREPSESFSISGSSAETATTRCWRALIFRPSPILSIFVSRFDKTNYLVGVLFSGRLYEPVVSITASVYHIYVACIGAGKDEEVVVEELHLEDRLLCAHRLHLELLGAHYLGLDLLFVPGHGALRLGRAALELPVPAVDLASPKAPHLPLQLVGHAVYGGVHVLGGHARLQDRPVDEQRRLGHLGLRDGRVALVDQLDLGPGDATLVVEELADALDLLEGVPLQRLRHRHVAPLDRHVHVRLPSGTFSTLRANALCSQHFSLLSPWCYPGSFNSGMFARCLTANSQLSEAC